ncbi:Hypothetical predicted protein, partial [Pelobates cultripes]
MYMLLRGQPAHTSVAIYSLHTTWGPRGRYTVFHLSLYTRQRQRTQRSLTKKPAPTHPHPLTHRSLLWSNNIRGQNSLERRSYLLRSLWAARVSVAFLQETHFQGLTGPMLRDQRFPLGFFANHKEAKRAVVAILFANHTPFTCTEEKADTLGRYLFLKGTIVDRQYTFASIYAPKTKQHNFISKTLRLLEQFREGILIGAGDLNLLIDPRVDTSKGRSSLPLSCLKATQAALRDAGLVDSWRVLHPDDRYFTYYSLVHHGYSCLDYILIAQEYLSLLQTSAILPVTWSDHSPMLTLLTSPPHKPKG